MGHINFPELPVGTIIEYRYGVSTYTISMQGHSSTTFLYKGNVRETTLVLNTNIDRMAFDESAWKVKKVKKLLIKDLLC